MTSVTLMVFALWITAARCVAINVTCDERYASITPEHTMCKSINEECRFLRHGGQMFGEQLLRTHNLIRNSIRRYVGRNYHLATTMELMHWDEELYAMARMHSLQCVNEPDCNLCHQIGDFPVEQNFAVRTFKRSEVAGSPVRRFQTVIKEWAAELRLYDRDVVKSFSFKEGLPTHWTNILRATTIFVGCASMDFIEDDPDIFKEVYICNYGPANLTEGEEIYKTGKKSCSECEDDVGCDPEFKRLCFPGEVEVENITLIFPEEEMEMLNPTDITEEEVIPMREEIEEEGVSGTEMYPEEETKVVTITGVPWFASTGRPGLASTGKPRIASTGAPGIAPTGTSRIVSTGKPRTASTGAPWIAPTGMPGIRVIGTPKAVKHIVRKQQQIRNRTFNSNKIHHPYKKISRNKRLQQRPRIFKEIKTLSRKSA